MFDYRNNCPTGQKVTNDPRKPLFSGPTFVGMVDELSRADIDAFLDTQVVGRVACHLDGETYIVPVIFAWSDDAVWVFTTEGKKVDFMRANPAVCFEVDERRDNGTWTSVIITGRYEELSGDDVTRTLSLLSSRFPPRPASASPEPRGEGRPHVAFRITATHVTGRRKA